jgi:hypothetical protein
MLNKTELNVATNSALLFVSQKLFLFLYFAQKLTDNARRELVLQEFLKAAYSFKTQHGSLSFRLRFSTRLFRLGPGFDLASLEQFFIYNSHLTDDHKQIREEFTKKSKQLFMRKKFPVHLSGDFELAKLNDNDKLAVTGFDRERMWVNNQLNHNIPSIRADLKILHSELKIFLGEKGITSKTMTKLHFGNTANIFSLVQQNERIKWFVDDEVSNTGIRMLNSTLGELVFCLIPSGLFLGLFLRYSTFIGLRDNEASIISNVSLILAAFGIIYVLIACYLSKILNISLAANVSFIPSDTFKDGLGNYIAQLSVVKESPPKKSNDKKQKEKIAEVLLEKKALDDAHSETPEEQQKDISATVEDVLSEITADSPIELSNVSPTPSLVNENPIATSSNIVLNAYHKKEKRSSVKSTLVEKKNSAKESDEPKPPVTWDPNDTGEYVEIPKDVKRFLKPMHVKYMGLNAYGKYLLYPTKEFHLIGDTAYTALCNNAKSVAEKGFNKKGIKIHPDHSATLKLMDGRRIDCVPINAKTEDGEIRIIEKTFVFRRK